MNLASVKKMKIDHNGLYIGLNKKLIAGGLAAAAGALAAAAGVLAAVAIHHRFAVEPRR